MMGAGKTIVGRTLAAKFDVPFHDTDRLLEYKLGRPVHQLFQLYGEAAFRAQETSVLSSIEAQPSVLATGGGIVLLDENWTEIRRIGVSLFLDVDIDVLVHRLRTAKKRRPLLEVPNWEETVRNMLNTRRSQYEKADIVLKLSDEPFEQVAELAVQELSRADGSA